VTLVGLGAVAAFATDGFCDLFNKTYVLKPGTALARAGCAVCHISDDNLALNNYGKSLDGKPVTVRSLRSVEKVDSDNDKYANITEIRAGSLPGNAKSRPKK
jgi:mono/diheme cytochrome c family protein